MLIITIKWPKNKEIFVYLFVFFFITKISMINFITEKNM